MKKFEITIIFVMVVLLSFLLVNSIKSCNESVKKEGLKNIIHETVKDYWEADSTKKDTINKIIN